MKAIKTKLQSWGFNTSHIQLLTVAVGIFAVLFVAKSGVNIKTMFVQADDEKTMVTYEQIRDQVTADVGGTIPETSDAEDAQQMALLDPELEDGVVLGESTGLGELTPVEQLFSQESLDQIKIDTINDNSNQAIRKYADQLSYVEAKYDMLTVLANMNSGNPDEIKSAQQQSTTLVQALKTMKVPTPLVEFHKYKMIYLLSLSSIGDIWLGNRPETDLDVQSKIMFSIMNKLEAVKTEINDQYQVQL